MNRLVGNPPGAATNETMGALEVEALRPLVVATSTDGHRHTLAAGARLHVEVGVDSVWSYLAVRGGIAVEPVLGSRSQDTLGNVGPPPLVDGSLVAVGDDPGTPLDADHAPSRARTSGRIRVWDGPHHDWFVGGTTCLTARTWTVTNELSRVGVRLDPGDFPPSTRTQAAMPSLGLTAGAIQITPAGVPIVMLANHPTTGGYPVIAVVDPDDLADLAQTQPGTSVSFRRA
jgi:allophanate hydrolase subunit 2